MFLRDIGFMAGVGRVPLIALDGRISLYGSRKHVWRRDIAGPRAFSARRIASCMSEVPAIWKGDFKVLTAFRSRTYQMGFASSHLI